MASSSVNFCRKSRTVLNENPSKLVSWMKLSLKVYDVSVHLQCFHAIDGGVTDSAGDIALVGTDGWVMTSNPPPLQYLDAIFSANW